MKTMEIKICEKCKTEYNIQNAKESHCRTNCSVCGDFDWYYNIKVKEIEKYHYPICKDCGLLRPPEDVLVGEKTCGCDRTEERIVIRLGVLTHALETFELSDETKEKIKIRINNLKNQLKDLKEVKK